MFVTVYSTAISALELVSVLTANYKSETIERFVPIQLVNADGTALLVEVKIDPERMKSSADLADDTELIRCITSEGFAVDFLSPPPDAREAEPNSPAYAFVDRRIAHP